jgi:hypothetical protein
MNFDFTIYDKPGQASQKQTLFGMKNIEQAENELIELYENSDISLNAQIYLHYWTNENVLKSTYIKR